MKERLLKKTLLALAILFVSACSNENLVEENKSLQDPPKKNDYYKKWIKNLEGYDLNKILEEEEKNMLNRSVKAVKREKRTLEKPIFVHYMPWFRSKEIDGAWGQHWTMTNKNPDVINSEEKREIASHYYPLIGPYSTKDKYLQQYHLLLMKLSGVDGVIFDWYGKRDILDFEEIKQGMESFVSELEKTSLEFSVMYEDRVVKEQARSLTQLQINQAIGDLKYIEQKYLSKDCYIQIESNPLLMIFGPSYIDNATDWSTILNSISTNVNLLALWNATNLLGSTNTSGEYAWIDKNHLTTLSGYYLNNVDFNKDIVGGVAYPRFDDFYIEGGWKLPEEEDWSLDGRGIDVFKESFDESLRHSVDFIQIATWNDFGEGTQIEPTKEHRFLHLEELQEYTKTSYEKEDLRIPYYIYKLRKKHSNNFIVKFLMDVAHWYAMNNRIAKAKRLVSITIHYFGNDFL
ncbi:glycoside hydrolase family 71/99-like protein [uncultured Tenacibaculum sp.]|uniref:glycoside hydrolase family 71/99-like protein n=1 Tax=uncultured Tenacibaculum sp. TaxID=174713 RepID=UPI00261F0302|nr:glycoside hydrolase family 71/99-like protein [uncultured Tenacibaculum sp.]